MDKVYIITGANRGLGEAFINEVLTRSDTYAVALSRQLSVKQNDILTAANFMFIEQDLAKAINYEGFNKLKPIVNAKTEIVFINNAGTINPLDDVLSLKDQDIIDAVNINIVSAVLIIKYLLNQFKHNTFTVVNITSGAANKSISNWSIYSASKAFINRFFEILKVENTDNKNFSFVSIDPGLVDTGMQATIRSSNFPLRHTFEEASKAGKLVTPAEAAKRILAQLQL